MEGNLRIIKRVFCCVAILAAALFVVVTSARAQSNFGSVVGSVTDSTGAVVSGAAVTLTNIATGEKRTATTDGSGSYQLLSLQTGTYKIDIESSGFNHYTRSPIDVLVDQAARVNVSLKVGSVSQNVVVTAASPILQSENASLGQVIQGKAVSDIPLNGRNVLALVGLVPGVVPQGSSGANLTGQNVFAAGNYQMGGSAANQSSTLYDGAPVNISYGNIVVLVPSQDSVQEFRVQTSDNTAEYGMYTGGVINLTSKSGSNGIHGTAFEFVRNTIFNATPYFSKHNPANILAKNPFHQNQFGGNIGFPVIKNRLFGFFDYQGYRQAQQRLYNYTVPTLLMLQGNFIQSTKPIYDPCGGTVAGGEGCPNYTGPRTAFAGNIIPASRMSPVARNFIRFPYWAAPTTSGTTNNFIKYAGSGGVNDQYTGRVDFVRSDKQHIFGRYTQWNSHNIGAAPYGNGLIGGDPISPEAFKTRQAVVGDTYLFSPSLIGDLRFSYLRWAYVRTPGLLGFDWTTLGFPADLGTPQDELSHVANSTTFPSVSLSNPTINNVSSLYLFGTNQNYVIAPTITKIIGTHAIKAGADLRRLEGLIYDPGEGFNFDPNMSASAGVGATGTSGNPFASFLMGYMSGGSILITPPTYTQIYYQGYFVQDNWSVTPKLTLNLGLRYEIPGVYRERHELLATFNPAEVNPVLGAVSINGKPVTGSYDLVGTPLHPAVGLRNEHFTDFSPRLGVAFRMNDKTVIRAAWGKYIIPSDLQFPESAAQSPLSYIRNAASTTLDNGTTPNATLDNPFPSGLTPAPGRNPNFQQLLLGQSAIALQPDEPNGVSYQWNFAIQRQFPLGIVVQAAYAGSHGSHLPVNIGVNQVPEATLAAAHNDPACNNPKTGPSATCFLTKKVPNPFNTSLFRGGVVQQYSTISSVQLYRPFPQYGSIANTGDYAGFSNYNALELKAEKRLKSGGVVLGSYTFSKYMNNAESLTSWLETAGAASFQDTNNLGAEYSLSGYDSRQRLVVSYVYSLPFGRDQHFGAGVSGISDKLVSGWAVNGVSTFQEGYPIGLTDSSGVVTAYSGTGVTRPNVVQGCEKSIHGPVQSRLGDGFSQHKYFNTSCFTSPAAFTFGNESRQDNQLRLPGVANWDLALVKDTHLTEGVVLQLRAESFNLFNRVQFGAPNTSIGSAQVGQITTQANDPRLLQFAGRINF